jgi:type I restriction enzyme S subunit
VSPVSSIALHEIMASRSGSVDPSRFPDEVFDLYSIPAFDSREPEIIAGKSIGSAKQIVGPNDVLLSKIVPHIRRSWVVGRERGRRIIASGEWIVFRSDRVHPDYLRHVLVGDPFHAQFMNTVSGVGGSLLRARPEHVGKIEIPLPPLVEQRRIAEVLDRAQALRAKRRAALAQLDALTQSIFVDLFGDPTTNPKGFPRGNIEVAVKDPKKDIRCGPFGTQLRVHELVGSGIPLLGIENVLDDGFQPETRKFLTDVKAEQLRAFDVASGDVLPNLCTGFELRGEN